MRHRKPTRIREAPLLRCRFAFDHRRIADLGEGRARYLGTHGSLYVLARRVRTRTYGPVE